MQIIETIVAAIIGSLIVLAAAAGFLFFQAPMANASTMKQVFDASYGLYVGNRFICSGQFVKSAPDKPDYFLTAAHCVDGVQPYNIRKQHFDKKLNVISETIYYLEIQKVLSNLDVALLVTKDHSDSFETVDIATPDEADGYLDIGSPVLVSAFPSGESITLTRGEYSGMKKSPFPAVTSLLYRSTVAVTGGSSGGGLYAEMDGGFKLIGTVTGGRRDVGFLNLFSLASSVHIATRWLFIGGSSDDE